MHYGTLLDGFLAVTDRDPREAAESRGICFDCLVAVARDVMNHQEIPGHVAVAAGIVIGHQLAAPQEA